jgi:hypothetical protein
MSKPKRFIYWRAEARSFLPEIDEQELTELLNEEFARYQRGRNDGSVVSHGDYNRNHMELVEVKRKRKGETTSEYRVKKGSEAVLSDYQSLVKVGVTCREMFGNWIEPNLIYHCLYSMYDKESGIMIPDEQRSKAVELAKKAIYEQREFVDDFLKSSHDFLPSNQIERGSPADNFIYLFEHLTRNLSKQTACSDRWFDELCWNLSFYSETLAIQVTHEQIDEIADKHFESWMSPGDEATTRFADELSAVFVKKLFEQEYGNS